ncbi:MAG: YdcH family protein [Myxococcota bacterium]|nr:YdcH family protein [Myxococcota bacterium]MDW8362280.1 YdcH family protein [Myxococcales bacterium]
MSRASHFVDPRQLERLEQRHAWLDARVAELDRRSYLTVPEQMERQRLKKEKLATKDRLVALRRQGF